MAVVLAIPFLAAGGAKAQSLTVLPVTIQMGPGEMAAALTVVNQGASETAIQVRAFAWSQAADGSEQITATEDMLASPPLGTIAPKAAQVVRLVLRRPLQGREATYRVLLDQIPAPAQPGTVRVALRLSIPIFVQPATRAAPHVQFHVEQNADQIDLVAVNDGGRHDAIHDIKLTTREGGVLKPEANVSPYVLAGATRRWRIVTPARPTAMGTAFRLTAKADEAGPVDQPVSVVGRP